MYTNNYDFKLYYSSKNKDVPTLSRKLMGDEEVDDKSSAKIAPSQSVLTAKANAVSNVTYSEIVHTKPVMICSGYATIGPEEVLT